MSPAGQSSSSKTSGKVVLLVFGSFLVWCYVYLVILRPLINAWLAQYVSGYPAMLHMIPLIGVPIALAGLARFFSKE